MQSWKHSYFTEGCHNFNFHQQYGLNLQIKYFFKFIVTTVQAKRVYVMVLNFAGAISMLVKLVLI